MFAVYVVGTAGSGKTALTGAFSDWLRDQEQLAATVNLDPAVLSLPYEPDVDVREFVDYERIMATRNLGPNGALIASVREITRHIEELREAVNEVKADWLIIDTPGQLELFAFRKEGRIIANNLTRGRRAMLFLIDPMFCVNPRNFAASLFLSASVQAVLGIPSVQVLTKIDAIPRKYVERILDWHESEEAFEVDADAKLRGLQVALIKDVMHGIRHLSASTPLVPVSATNLEGFVELHSILSRTLGEGELELR
ncbi:MAG: ATP/GTP-binding protein [Aigarchaeota archaeon]|nr:ATP/GTP-binding protein [Candidatus Pelearchaeum maunauluense]